MLKRTFFQRFTYLQNLPDSLLQLIFVTFCIGNFFGQLQIIIRK